MTRVRFKLGARALALAVGLAMMAMPLMAGAAFAAVGDRTLNLDPEQDDEAVGNSHTVKAALSTAPDALNPIQIDFEVAGVGDPRSDGDSPSSPDLSCTVFDGQVDNPATGNTDESRTCTVHYRGQLTGHDEIRGWIDADGSDATVEADLGEEISPADADNTDVVFNEWWGDLPNTARLDCSPEPFAASVGVASKSVVCQLSGVSDDLLQGWQIDGENLGGANETDDVNANPADHDNACTTGANGRCKPVVPSTQTGSANLCFWVDWDVDQGFQPPSEADGDSCDESANDSADNANITDVVQYSWKYDRTFSWNQVASPKAGKHFMLGGKVSSLGASCKSNVKVTIRKTPVGGTQKFAGTVTSKSDGRFSIKLLAGKSSRYTASVAVTSACNAKTSISKFVRVRKK